MRHPLLLAVFAAFLALSPVASAQGATDGAAGAETKEEPTIPGVVLTRPDGRFLGVETEGVTMRVTFYNKEKEKESADAVRISARWTDSRPRFTVLLPVAPETLASPGVLSRPFNYLVYLTLVGPDDAVLESHSLRLR
jgi:hypothetical protein